MIKKIVKENLVYIIILFVLSIMYYIAFNSSIYNYILDFDYKIIEMVNVVENKGLTIFFRIITDTLGFILPVLVILYMVIHIKDKLYINLIAPSYLLSVLYVGIIKIIIARPRPLVALIKIPITHSFPSGHTLSAMVFYTLMCYILTLKSKEVVRNLYMILFTVIIFLVGLSRIYLGVHFFSDVMAGLLFGIVFVLMFINIIEKNFKEKII